MRWSCQQADGGMNFRKEACCQGVCLGSPTPNTWVSKVTVGRLPRSLGVRVTVSGTFERAHGQTLSLRDGQALPSKACLEVLISIFINTTKVAPCVWEERPALCFSMRETQEPPSRFRSLRLAFCEQHDYTVFHKRDTSRICVCVCVCVCG